jgi:hypothetical protein
MTTLERPAWREPMVWLVAGGPAAVVVASFATLALAIIHPDPPLDLHAAATTAHAADDAEPADVRTHEGDLVPALVARNHAATGGPKPKPAAQP